MTYVGDPGGTGQELHQAFLGMVEGYLEFTYQHYSSYHYQDVYIPPGKGNGGGGKAWPGWFWGSMGFAWAWPSAA